MSEVISSFKILRAGSQVFALRMLFLCVILHTMWSGKSLPVFNHVAPYGYLLPNMYLFITDITNPDSIVGPHDRISQKTANQAPIVGGGKVRPNFHSSL